MSMPFGAERRPCSTVMICASFGTHLASSRPPGGSSSMDDCLQFHTVRGEGCSRGCFTPGPSGELSCLKPLTLTQIPGQSLRRGELVGRMGRRISKQDFFTRTVSSVYTYFNHEKFFRETGLPKQDLRW